MLVSRSSKTAEKVIYKSVMLGLTWAQLFDGRLALNPGLNLTQVSLSCVQKHFLG